MTSVVSSLNKRNLNQNGLSKSSVKVAAMLIIWFIVILLLSLNQFFVPVRGEPPLNILLSALLSIGVFFLAYWRADKFRNFVLNIDMRFLIMLHSWRMLGMGFVMLYMLDQLPPLFAFLAGFGDAATAIAAVFLTYALFIRAEGVSKKTIWRWNAFGLVDFIIAVSIGILTQTDALFFSASGISSDLMTVYPFVLVPAFLVQVFTITHIIIFLQLRHSKKDDNYIKFEPQGVSE